MPTHETEPAGRGLSKEIERLRETNARLNRRAQIAEAAINELANGTGSGKSKAVSREIWTRCEGTHERYCKRAARAEAEVARLRAQVAAVEALTGEWETFGSFDVVYETAGELAAALRNALADPASVLRERDAAKFGQGVQTAREHGWLKALAMNPYRDRGGDDGRA